jgi:Zn-dependent peptidase ImmA (M78 family)
MQSFDQQRDDEALQEFARLFADKFKVSKVAMRIRLEKLGLLHREVSRQGSLNIGL